MMIAFLDIELKKNIVLEPSSNLWVNRQVNYAKELI